MRIDPLIETTPSVRELVSPGSGHGTARQQPVPQILPRAGNW
uniref:Uncharacterized protein n=1 Tax=Magnetospirillum gryphiswaldense TaxID=55518 RepID=A4U1Y7_9PROT|nr:hypothetical protein MGR_0894 [Magnetospirillum gryphiswaldense MSR-1]